MLGKKKYSAEKKFEIKFTEDKVAEVAVSLELKSRTFANTATQNKKRKTKLRKSSRSTSKSNIYRAQFEKS